MKSKKTIKRWISLLLTLALIAGAGTAAAWADAPLTLSVGSVIAAPGTELEVPVSVSNASGLAMVQFALNYDSDMLEYLNNKDNVEAAEGYTLGAMLNNHTAPSIASRTEGTINFLFEDTNTLNGSGELVRFRFRVKQALSSVTVISIADNNKLILADINMDDFDYELASGYVGIPGLKLPANLSSIKENAFAGVPATIVYAPDNVTDIAANAFDRTVTLIVKAGTQAEDAAQNSGLNFIAIP